MTLKGDNMAGLKRVNRSLILKLLHEQGSMSRKKISQHLGLTPAAITMIVADLIHEGLLTEGVTIPGNGSAGRREVLININAPSRIALGISINLEDACLCAVDLEGTILFAEHRVLEPQAKAAEVVPKLSADLFDLIEKYRVDRARIIGLGVTIRGIIDRRSSRSIFSFDALLEKNVPLKEMFEKETGFPVVLENNVRSIFEAHIFMSRSQKYSSLFFIRCEYGIGAALMINHRIWNGSNGRCAELGHTPVVPVGGKPCRCGKSGCLETISSPMAIREDVLSIYSESQTPLLYKMTENMPKEDITIDLVLEAARRGDRGTADIVNRAIYTLTNSLKTVIYTVDPEKVILYGRMFENSYYLAKLVAALKVGFDGESEPIVEKSEFNLTLEDRAAAIVILDRYFENGGILPLTLTSEDE